MNNKFLIILAILSVFLGGVKLYTSYEADKAGIRKGAVNEKSAERHIIIYSRAGCIYCTKAKELLGDSGVKYELIELSNNEDLYNKLVSKTGQKTVPYIFIDDEYIGGYSDLAKLKEYGKL